MEQMGEIALRTFVSYLALLILTRIMGRKQISELTFFDYVTGITIGTIAGSISFDARTSLSAGLVALAFWTLWTLISDKITLKSVPARKFMVSEPMVVIREGQILEQALQDRYYNINDLLMQLREQGVFDPTEIKIGIIETDGKLSVLKNSQNSAQTNTKTINTGLQSVAKEIIIDGQLSEDNLQSLGLSKDWLFSELRKQGITDIHSVALAMITPSGMLYVDKTQDNVAQS